MNEIHAFSVPVFLDVLNSVFLIPQPVSWVFAAKLADNGNGCLGHVAREFDLLDASQNYVVNLHGITGCERWPEMKVLF